MTLCPECRKPIEDDDALLCLYCGSSLQNQKKPIWKWLIALIVIASFALLIIMQK